MTNTEPVTFSDPTFGTVTLDQWGCDFWTLWKFSEFCPFPDPDDNPFDGVQSHHVPLIEDWPNSIPELSKICRISNVHYALRYRRLCEVSIGRSEDEGIHPDQRAAFQEFVEAEAEITDEVLNANR